MTPGLATGQRVRIKKLHGVLDSGDDETRALFIALECPQTPYYVQGSSFLTYRGPCAVTCPHISSLVPAAFPLAVIGWWLFTRFIRIGTQSSCMRFLQAPPVRQRVDSSYTCSLATIESWAVELRLKIGAKDPTTYCTRQARQDTSFHHVPYLVP